MSLTGKAALVTGGARGIGRAICLELAERGADICVADVMDATETVAEVEARGARCMARTCDVTKPDEVASVVKDVVDEFGNLTILVNNAGITKDNLLMRMSEDEWDAVLAVNLKGAFVCTKAVVRQMMRQKAGRIVNISSVVGIFGNPGQANYAASKAGLIGLTKAVAKEVGSRGITVNAVAPGYILTEMTEKLGNEAREAFAQNIPLSRPDADDEKAGTVEDVAKCVAFLAGDDASYVTGQVLPIDGGLAM
ncbi:MAG: 3-oxoacyl-[acyl-carrier-protein] reductase [Planctomycetota bacterium]